MNSPRPPFPIGFLCLALGGYGLTWYFWVLAIVMPGPKHDARFLGQLISFFEVGLFFYLAFIAVPLIGIGWACILLMAYFRKGRLCTLTLSIMGIYSYVRTSYAFGHNITWSDIAAGTNYFFDVQSFAFWAVIFPLLLTLCLIVFLIFRPIRKNEFP